MQNHETHFFLATIRKSDGHRQISPVAFPEEEVKRRIQKQGPRLKKDWRFVPVLAPKGHPRWNPDYRDCPLEIHRKRVALGQSLLEQNEHYGLMEVEL